MKQQLISLRIKEILKEKGWSITKFAKLLDTDLACVSRWVNGHSNFRIDTIEKMEKVLEVELIVIK